MAATKPTAKLSYIAIMLLAAGFLLLYIFRGSSHPTTGTPGANKPESTAQKPAVQPGPAASSETVLARGGAAAVKKAIQRGLDVNAALTAGQFAGLAPLHIVASRNSTGVIPVLVAAGASVDAQSADRSA